MGNKTGDDWLESIAEELAESYIVLEEEILADICRRFQTTDTATASALHQIRQLQEQGIDMKVIESKIKKTLNITQKQLDDMFQEAVAREQAYTAELLDKAKITKPSIRNQVLLLQEIAIIKQQTKKEMYNITQSLGFSFKVNGKPQFYYIAEAYQKVLDVAYLEVSTGVLDYNTAAKNAVKKLSDSGMKYVYYDKEGKKPFEPPKRYVNHVDVAVKRAIRTGISQAQGILSENTINTLETPYVEVTAHAGARTGSGITNHAGWQGQVYYWKEKSEYGENTLHYPDFVDTTGYGEGAGLKGYNCSHNFRAFIPNVSSRIYTDEELYHMANDTFSYKGKDYTMYEATQYMRKIERDMRQLKRNLIGFNNPNTQKEFENTAIKLQKKSKEYTAFSRAASLKKRIPSTQVLGFDKALAAKARRVYK